jgi:DNA modification methylase
MIVHNPNKLPTASIADLLPTQGELKDLSTENYEKLKKNIERRGFIDPVAVWEDKNGIKYILNGHQRQRVLANEGWIEPIPYFNVPAKTLQEAAAIVLELTSQYGKITQEGLDAHIAKYDLPEAEIYEATHFDALSFYDTSEPEQEVEEDEAPEVDESEPPKSKLGKIYQLGRHRVMCGDSTNIEQFEKLVNDKRATLVFTDPPYGVSYQSNMRVKSKKFEILKNDNVISIDGVVTASEYSDGWIMVCTSWKVLRQWLEALELFGEPSNIIIWDKGGGGIGDLKHTLLTDYEVIISYNRGAKIIGKRIGSVWDCGKDAAGSYEHPTQKPVALSALAINTMTNKGDYVFDVYLGSGSTLIACEQTDRTCYGMELDPKYVDVIRKRYAKFIQPDDQLPENWEELTPAIN